MFLSSGVIHSLGIDSNVQSIRTSVVELLPTFVGRVLLQGRAGGQKYVPPSSGRNVNPPTHHLNQSLRSNGRYKIHNVLHHVLQNDETVTLQKNNVHNAQLLVKTCAPCFMCRSLFTSKT